MCVRRVGSSSSALAQSHKACAALGTLQLANMLASMLGRWPASDALSCGLTSQAHDLVPAIEAIIRYCFSIFTDDEQVRLTRFLSIFHPMFHPDSIFVGASVPTMIVLLIFVAFVWSSSHSCVAAEECTLEARCRVGERGEPNVTWAKPDVWCTAAWHGSLCTDSVVQMCCHLLCRAAADSQQRLRQPWR